MGLNLSTRLLSTLGVTRVARITGLDRAGIEVACAIRPGGHLLQVSNGKAFTFAEAALGAVMEAAELWCAERPLGTFEEASQQELHGEAWGPELFGPVQSWWSRALRIRWVRARRLDQTGNVWVPAQVAFCPPASGPALGPTAHRWTSNGMGAHPSRARALRHALLEAIERDQLARALPEGWTYSEVRRRRVCAQGLPPRLASLLESLQANGLLAFLFDLSVAGGLGLPLGGALLFDREQGPLPLAAGYACRFTLEQALTAALLEAAQSRLTDVHGARDDVVPQDRQDAELLRSWCDAPPGRKRTALPATGPQSVASLLSRLAAKGHRSAAVVELAPRGLGVSVVRALVPGLLLSELL